MVGGDEVRNLAGQREMFTAMTREVGKLNLIGPCVWSVSIIFLFRPSSQLISIMIML